MKFLFWEIKYAGHMLSVFNRKLIRDAKAAGLKDRPEYGNSFNKLLAIKHIKGETGASLQESKEFCEKYVLPKAWAKKEGQCLQNK